MRIQASSGYVDVNEGYDKGADGSDGFITIGRVE